MFAVIFEVRPKSALWQDYLSLAQSLRPELERIDGFIDNERFSSQRTEGRLLSLSTWRDEKALIRWRTQELHHAVQEKGRSRVFADYHLRVGEITEDTAAPDGEGQAGVRFDATETGAAKVLTITETAAPSVAGSALARLRLPEIGAEGLVDRETYESIATPGKLLLLASWKAPAAAAAWLDSAQGSSIRHRAVRVIRDYGMTDRREAPQYYPPVAPSDLDG